VNENKKITNKEMLRLVLRSLENLDTRETLLQKEVARLSERIHWVTEILNSMKEQGRQRAIRDRFIAALLAGLAVSLVQIAIELWRIFH